MSLEEKFEKAQEDVETLSERPDNETLLELYALYKQASEGDVSGDRPGMFDIKGRAKYDAWAEKEGVDEETAMEEYVALVEKLLAEE